MLFLLPFIGAIPTAVKNHEEKKQRRVFVGSQRIVMAMQSSTMGNFREMEEEEFPFKDWKACTVNEECASKCCSNIWSDDPAQTFQCHPKPACQSG